MISYLDGHEVGPLPGLNAGTLEAAICISSPEGCHGQPASFKWPPNW